MNTNEQGTSSPIVEDTLLGIDEVAATFGVTRQSILADRHHGGDRFPPALKNYRSPLRWKASTVRAFFDAMEEEQVAA